MSWYDYQDWEWRMMKSSVMPDKIKDEKTFVDATIAKKASEQIKKFATSSSLSSSYWMTGIGFKMPHTALHIPSRYYDMYNDKRHVWSNMIDKNPNLLKFPTNTPPVSYRCCAEKNWRFINKDDDNNSNNNGNSIGGGFKKSNKFEQLGNINKTLSKEKIYTMKNPSI